MLTTSWKKRRVANGKYHVECIDACGAFTLPGMILGGNGRWIVQIAGNQIPTIYRTADSAAAAIVRAHYGT